MLLPGKAAGRTPAHTAGAVEFRATFTWRTPEDMTSTSVLASLSCSDNVEAFTETDDKHHATRNISGEILALDEPELSLALDGVLRAVSNTAALTGAILEVRVVRHAKPPGLLWEEMPQTP